MDAMNIKKILKIFLIYLIPAFGIIRLVQFQNYKYNTIIISFLILLLILLYKNNVKSLKNKKIVIISVIYAILFTLGTIIDQQYDFYSYSFFFELGTIFWKIYSVTIFFIPIINRLLDFISNISNEKLYIKDIRKNYIFIFIFLMICWLPYLINYFPCLMSPDSINQWNQAAGIIELSNHHPIMHTLFIKIFYIIGSIINNPNLGLMFYSLTQIIIMDLIFTYVLSFLIHKKCNKKIVLLSTLFFGLVPIFGFYSVTMWKDVLFGCGALLLMLQLYKFIDDNNFNVKDRILLILGVLWTCLFRTNGLYSIILLDIILIIFMKKSRFKIFKYFIISTIISILIIGPIYSCFGIKKTEFTENIGIPIKQIYGVISEGLTIDKQDRKFLNKLVKEKDAVNTYSPYGDEIKSLKSYNNEFLENNKAEFLKIWIKLGVRYPKKYVDVYLKSTYGFWYPEAQGYIVQLWPFEDNNNHIKSNKHYNFLRIAEYFNWFYNFPILKYLLSDAFCFWILLFSLGVCWIKKIGKYIYTLLIPLFIWLTIMVASPISYQPRYTFILYCAIPLELFIISNCFNLLKGGKEKNER